MPEPCRCRQCCCGTSAISQLVLLMVWYSSHTLLPHGPGLSSKRELGEEVAADLVGSLLVPLDHYSVFCTEIPVGTQYQVDSQHSRTGAHVLKGKILHKCMVNLWMSNSKLFWRAVSVPQVLSSWETAQ